MKSFYVPSLCIALVLATVWAIGCDNSTNSGGSDMDALAAQLEQSKQAAADAAAAEQSRLAGEAATQQATAQAEQPAVPPSEGGKTIAGSATVGQGGGYYSAIVAAHRHITTRVDDLAWLQAIQHYKATTGNMPKDHDEFMKGVIEGFGIELPLLEEGEEYLWVPDEGELGTLYVVRKEQ